MFEYAQHKNDPVCYLLKIGIVTRDEEYPMNIFYES